MSATLEPLLLRQLLNHSSSLLYDGTAVRRGTLAKEWRRDGITPFKEWQHTNGAHVSRHTTDARRRVQSGDPENVSRSTRLLAHPAACAYGHDKRIECKTISLAVIPVTKVEPKQKH